MFAHALWRVIALILFASLALGVQTPHGLAQGLLGQSTESRLAAATIFGPAVRSLPRTTVAKRPQKVGYGVFGSVAIPVAGPSVQRMWQRAVASSETLTLDEGCATSISDCPHDLLRVWSSLQPLVENRAEAELASIVNRAVNNSLTYESDRKNYDRTDHWASITELVRTGSGDCEDFALAKYWLLRQFGVPENLMQLVVVRDIRRRNLHAVLVVHLAGGGIVLDNLEDETTDAGDISYYQPVISYVGHESFIHGFETSR